MTAAPLRSLLFVPATRPDRFQKALDSGADAVIFDLEDAVEPTRKSEARHKLAEWLASAPGSAAAILIRVNAPGSPWQDEDLMWLADVRRPAAVVLPKAESASDVEHVANALPGRAVMPMIETARGVFRAAEIFSARALIPAVIFGAEDLTAELGIPRTLDGDELLYARSQIVLAAAAASGSPGPETPGTIEAPRNIDAIDAIWAKLKSPDALRTDAARARALGFRGKTAIHPEQVAIINEVFSPTAEEVAEAERVIAAADRAFAAGDGAFRLNDQMVDAPVITRARRLLELAKRLTKRA